MLAEQGWSLMVDLDEYEVLSVANCAVESPDVYRLNGLEIATSSNVLASAQRLAWVDVINAADWILVVLILEFDVRMQLMGKLTDHVMMVSKWIKGVLYAVLLAAAVYLPSRRGPL